MSGVPQTVIVTGAADGIGRAIALRFLGAGWQVHIGDRQAEALGATLAAHAGLHGTVADVGRREDVAHLIDVARARFGAVGVLINNVGIGGPRAMIEDITEEDWNDSFRVNVGGMLACMQAVIPAMKAQGGGAIVNISTASTRTRLPLRTAYIASKFAVEGLTLNAARELGPFGIRCNAILPGVMNNSRMDGILGTRAAEQNRPVADIEREFLRTVSLRTRTEPEDVADMAYLLASPAGGRITGELIAVSGNLEWEE